MTRQVTIILTLALIACGGGKKGQGDADADPPPDLADLETAADPTPDPIDDPTPDPVPDPIEDPTTDPSEDPSTEVTTDPADDPAGDTTDEDSSSMCDTSKMRSGGIAPSPWGVGSFCDEIHACIASGASSSVLAIFPSATCGVSVSFCTTSSGACTVLNSVTVSASQWDDLCELSLLTGVLQIYCVVYA